MDEEIARWESEGGFVVAYSRESEIVEVQCSTVEEVQVVTRKLSNDTRFIGVSRDARRSEVLSK